MTPKGIIKVGDQLSCFVDVRTTTNNSAKKKGASFIFNSSPKGKKQVIKKKHLKRNVQSEGLKV